MMCAKCGKLNIDSTHVCRTFPIGTAYGPATGDTSGGRFVLEYESWDVIKGEAAMPPTDWTAAGIQSQARYRPQPAWSEDPLADVRPLMEIALRQNEDRPRWRKAVSVFRRWLGRFE